MKMDKFLEKMDRARGLYVDTFIDEKGEGADIETHTMLKCGVGAYMTGADDAYYHIKAYGIQFHYSQRQLEITYNDDLFRVDLDKWIYAVIHTLKVGEKQDYKLEDFKIEQVVNKVADKTVDSAIVKAAILDTLLSRDVSFNK